MEKTQDYINTLISKQKFGDKAMEEYAKECYIPIVKKDTANMLRVLIATKQPKKILEIGTAIGYSAKIMLSAYEQSHLTSLEIDYDRFEMAKKNLKKYANRVTLELCDAGDYLLNCEEKFDFIFLDGAKGHYLSYLQSLLNVMADNAILVADNVLQDGMTAGEKQTKQKNQSTVAKMQKFLEELCKSKELVTTILPIGDGLSISVLKAKEKENL